MAWRLRRKGIKTAFLCHNLFDHDSRGITRSISEALLKQADAYILHASDQIPTVRQISPSARILQRIHPIYDQFPKVKDALEKRGKLELLFFGFIRPYKGLDLLVRALSSLHNEDIYLSVVGEPWEDKKKLENDIRTSAGLAKVDLRLQFVDEGEAARYFARADVVVLPYRSATGSGVVTLAYNYGKPVLATRVGGLADAVKDGATGWLIEPDSVDALAKVIEGITRRKAESMKQSIALFCKDNSWSAMAEGICILARTLSKKEKT
jgi:glycosyltransferase involved in cell wall biosynthesis